MLCGRRSMGMVKWTGEGFKLLGNLLTNETVEGWLQSQGKELAERILKDMTAKWFFGHMRARRQVKRTVLSEVNSSKPLRMALNDTINKLPSVIRGLALTVEKMGIEELILKVSTFRKLIVVPRALVLNGFTLTLLEDFSDAAELKRFQALPDHFLRKQATEAEQVFCDQLLGDGAGVLVGKKGIILAADDQFDWHLRNIPGHYYYAYDDSYSTELTKRSERKEFLSDLKHALDEKMVQLGKLTTTEIDGISGRLFNKK